VGRAVDEILLTVDLHRSRGRFGEGWEARLPGLRELSEDCCPTYPHARCVDVDYGPKAREAVAATFFGGCAVPVKDFRGAPFYSYLFSLHSARHPRVFHLDSDMLLGGGSPSWVAEASDVLSGRPEVLPGPPAEDGTLRSQVLEPEAMRSRAFRSPAHSTRLFLMDLRRLPILQASKVIGRRAWGARLDGHPTFESAESVVSHAMARQGLIRVDFLGRQPGVWGVHPPWRSPTFYQRLPALIEGIEQGRIPDGQRGCHDIEDCMVDWTNVRPTARR
jgi:hypothetical protein